MRPEGRHLFEEVASSDAGLSETTCFEEEGSDESSKLEEVLGGGVESALSDTGVEPVNSEETMQGEGEGADTITGDTEEEMFLGFWTFSVKREPCIAKVKRGREETEGDA